MIPLFNELVSFGCFSPEIVPLVISLSDVATAR